MVGLGQTTPLRPPGGDEGLAEVNSLREVIKNDGFTGVSALTSSLSPITAIGQPLSKPAPLARDGRIRT